MHAFFAQRYSVSLSVRACLPPDIEVALWETEREYICNERIHVLVFPTAIITGEVKAVGDVRSIVVLPAETFQERLRRIDDTVLPRSLGRRYDLP